MAAVTARLCCTLLFVFEFVSGGQKNITAESGQDVTLPCRAPDNNIIIGVEWSRADLGTEYIILYRDRRFDPENQHPSFVNRVDLQDRQMKDGDVSLILKDVTTADEGTYECRVVQRGTNRMSRANLDAAPISIISLRVGPPGQPGGSVGVIVGVSVLVVLLLLAAVAGFVIYRKHKQQQSQDSYQHPAELQPVSNDSELLP